jgi:hypothetical protein
MGIVDLTKLQEALTASSSPNNNLEVEQVDTGTGKAATLG